jgi:hypothetical protein
MGMILPGRGPGNQLAQRHGPKGSSGRKEKWDKLVFSDINRSVSDNRSQSARIELIMIRDSEGLLVPVNKPSQLYVAPTLANNLQTEGLKCRDDILA